jgi:hypothetical protein
MNKKITLIVLALAVVLLATPLVSAKPWAYPKNNDKFEKFGVTFEFDWGPSLITANYIATAGLTEANKVVVVYEEQPLVYEIRIGEGAGMRTYTLGDDFTYSGEATATTWDPILPYAFDPGNALGTLFIPGSRQHFRVDYVYDFSAVPGGLEGTITMLALVTGNGQILSGDHPMFITSLEGTGDFKNVNIQATTDASFDHAGLVSGWPE